MVINTRDPIDTGLGCIRAPGFQLSPGLSVSAALNVRKHGRQRKSGRRGKEQGGSRQKFAVQGRAVGLRAV